MITFQRPMLVQASRERFVVRKPRSKATKEVAETQIEHCVAAALGTSTSHIEDFSVFSDYGRVHYVQRTGGVWVDEPLAYWSHDPGVAIGITPSAVALSGRF